MVQVLACARETERLGALLSQRSAVVVTSPILSSLVAVDVVTPTASLNASSQTESEFYASTASRSHVSLPTSSQLRALVLVLVLVHWLATIVSSLAVARHDDNI